MPPKEWSETGWERILHLSIVEARAGFKEYINPSHATAFGVPETFMDDLNFGNRLYWFLRPFVLAVEQINKCQRDRFERGDADLIIKLFSPWTLEIDHLTFALGIDRTDKVKDLFYDSGFQTIEIIEIVESSAKFPAHGKVLARHDPNTGRPLYVALLEGSQWYGTQDQNMFRTHTKCFGERTPFSLSLDASCLVSVKETAVHYRETNLEITLPVQKMLMCLISQDILPIETGGPTVGILKKDRGTIVTSFSTAPLKYGLRLEFIQRIRLMPGSREHFPLVNH